MNMMKEMGNIEAGGDPDGGSKARGGGGMAGMQQMMQ